MAGERVLLMARVSAGRRGSAGGADRRVEVRPAPCRGCLHSCRCGRRSLPADRRTQHEPGSHPFASEWSSRWRWSATRTAARPPLFNLLTGSRQKVANYAQSDRRTQGGTPDDTRRKTLRVLDLPGAYSLYPRSPDERVTSVTSSLAVLPARSDRPGSSVCGRRPNLRRNLRPGALAVKTPGPCLRGRSQHGRPAEKRGIGIVPRALATELRNAGGQHRLPSASRR